MRTTFDGDLKADRRRKTREKKGKSEKIDNGGQIWVVDK